MGCISGTSGPSLDTLNGNIQTALKDGKVFFSALRAKDRDFFKNDSVIFEKLKEGLTKNFTPELTGFLEIISSSSPDLDLLKMYIFGKYKAARSLDASSDDIENQLTSAYGSNVYVDGINISDNAAKQLPGKSTLSNIEDLIFAEHIVSLGMDQTWHAVKTQFVYKKKSDARAFYGLLEQLIPTTSTSTA